MALTPPPGDDWPSWWFRGAVAVVLTIAGFLYRRVDQRVSKLEDDLHEHVHDNIESVERRAHEIALEIKEGDGKIWDVIDVIRRDIGRHQVEIAHQVGQLVTREDHRRDIEALADRVDRAIATSTDRFDKAIDRLGTLLSGHAD